MNKQTIKAGLLDALIQLMDDRMEEIEHSLQAAKESRDNDTKSSAGDKYETGREMIQQEMDKQAAQLAKTGAMKNDLLKINPEKKYELAEFGSLLITNAGNYFLSIAYGKLAFMGDEYICLSLASPLGKSFFGKKAGDELIFGGKKMILVEIL